MVLEVARGVEVVLVVARGVVLVLVVARGVESVLVVARGVEVVLVVARGLVVVVVLNRPGRRGMGSGSSQHATHAINHFFHHQWLAAPLYGFG